MKYCSRKTIQSALPEFEGVSFTLTRMSDERRVQLDSALAPQREKIRQLSKETHELEWTLRHEMEAEHPCSKENLRILEILDEITQIRARVDRVIAEWGLYSINDLDVDDQPATLALLLAHGPWELYQEIVAAVKHEAGLSEAEIKNSASPTISPAAEGGRTNSSNAENVASPELS